jgi:hypothetical protein
MAITKKLPGDKTLQAGLPSQAYHHFMDTGVIPILPTYTVSTLPSAATYTRGLIYVSNGTTNKRLAVSDGTNWRFPDGNIVS